MAKPSKVRSPSPPTLHDNAGEFNVIQEPGDLG